MSYPNFCVLHKRGYVVNCPECVSDSMHSIGRPTARVHQESEHCWCHPTLNYTNPETGVQHWVHHEPN